MPRESTDRRKSSIGSRRGPPKKHIPFRADDLGLGKKTGIAVQYVGRDSDEFEPFDEVIKQADDRTPPRVKSRKKKATVVTPVPEFDEYDENGEMSMELAESNQGSPLAYFTNAPPIIAPNSARKSGSSRSVPRTSEIDFDEVPSPRMRAAPSRRASTVNGAGPSALHKSFSVYSDIHEYDAAPDPEFEPAYQDFGYEPPPNDSPPRSGTSSNDVNEDEVDDENDAAEVEKEMASHAKMKLGKGKGKRRADVEVEQQEENGIDEDIAQGLEEVENAPDEEEDEDPPPKKPRKEDPKEQKLKKPKAARAPKRIIKPFEENSPPPDGVRRSRRHRYKPLEYWRSEKVVYGRNDSGLILVPQIKEIIRIPQEPPKPLGKAGKKRKRTGSERAKSILEPVDPEEGWDDDTQESGVVIDYATEEPVLRRIVFTAKKVDPKPAAGGGWFFQKVFGEGDFIAAGVLRIPPQGRKPSKGTKDNTYVFYVIEGAVAAVIHESQYIVATGGMFIVPRGNTYYIENISDRDAKVFFTQARQVSLDEDQQLDHISHSAPPSSHPQRLSAGATSLGKRGTSMKM
ncbi:Mif2/CENP-C like-domain-containing protein [Suillus clintonianus]|uniref:Mif2/CENP-C like-domain-containing protein n=1 Tax=Suillus clintonianus TaxID=1904413 RepID=UPI001B874B2D|nr:Mif2/CENP-C like-domain-containing protein [Suillus clintonianus]KAG2146205.1 Mif2/CENP-C like-domain-containing protein [Suillus clintonianus]